MIEISVVVPVYGVERYIERCARSLFGQTMTDGVEFIFVDDCTPDGSIDVLRRVLADYPARQPQTRILRHPENRGLPQARKTGIEAALGQYILNVDSDDWLDTDACRALHEHASATKADIIAFGARFEASSTSYVFPQKLVPRGFMEDMIRMRNLWSVWSKLIRRQLYFEPDEILFPTNYMGEDLVQTYQLVKRAKIISCLALPLYFYRANNQIIIEKPRDMILREQKQMAENVEILVKIAGIDHETADWMRVQSKARLNPMFSKAITRKEYLDCYSSLNFSIFFNRYVPIRVKISHFIVLLGLDKL